LGTPFRQVMGRRPEILKAWHQLDEATRFAGVLPDTLKEEVRRTLASVHGCAFCASLGDPVAVIDDPRTKAAVALGKAIAEHPIGIDDASWNAAAQHFTDEELVELCAWICFMYAGEMFGALMRFGRATPEQKRLYEDWLSTGATKSRVATARS
jgi:alkylhydroperoxidase family enzyme